MRESIKCSSGRWHRHTRPIPVGKWLNEGLNRQPSSRVRKRNSSQVASSAEQMTKLTISFHACSTAKLASVSYHHETLPPRGVHTTTGSVSFPFHAEKHSVFIPYRFQAIIMPASCEREAYP